MNSPEPASPHSIDLGVVDDLCRLALAARRLGCRVRLEGASAELREVLDIAGVQDSLFAGDQPAVRARHADHTDPRTNLTDPTRQEADLR